MGTYVNTHSTFVFFHYQVCVDSTLNLVGSTIFFSFSFRYPWSSASSTEYSCYKNLSNQRTSYLYNHNTICINNHLIVSLIKLIHTSTTLFSTKNIFCTKYNYNLNLQINYVNLPQINQESQYNRMCSVSLSRQRSSHDL